MHEIHSNLCLEVSCQTNIIHIEDTSD